MTPIIPIVGPPDAGKTTLCRLLIQELAPSSMLVIDADPNQRLSEQLLLGRPPKTLSHTLDIKKTTFSRDMTQSPEVIDWAFSDLVTHVGPETDILTLGSLPEDVNGTQQSIWAYGLNRLINHYDVVVIDAARPSLLKIIQTQDWVFPLYVLTPDHARNATSLGPCDGVTSRIPALIINRIPCNAPLPEPFTRWLSKKTEEGDFRLIGRFPEYPSPDERIRQLPELFRNSLYHTDLPLNDMSFGKTPNPTLDA